MNGLNGLDGLDGKTERRLTLFDCVSIMVGIIIGSGIYETAPDIAGMAGSWQSMLAVWILGGLAALVGAICYAELTTHCARHGGDFAFLHLAYGRTMGVLFGWIEFWIIRPANVGAMTFVFARYAGRLLPLPIPEPWDQISYALLSLIGLTVLNLLGSRPGKWTQNLLSSLKVLGLLLICGAALLTPPAPAAPPVERQPLLPLALVLVLFTYGGWNDIAYVASEVKDPRKNLLRSLILGTSTVILIYVLVNSAFLRVLGYEGLATSQAVAAETLEASLRSWGGAAPARFAGGAISVLICLSCLGAISGMMFTGSRIYYAMGAEHPWFAWLGKWDRQRSAPLRALGLQSLVIGAMILGWGQGGDGFMRLALFAAPFFWFFLALVVVSLFVFRQHPLPGVADGFRVPLYPLPPLLFLGVCLYMLQSSVSYSVSEFSKEPHLPDMVWAAVVVSTGLLVAGSGSRATR